MNNPSIPPSLVTQAWQAMSLRYGTTICPKLTSRVMRLAAFFAVRFSKISRVDFLLRYATTIGGRIYIPFEVGKACPGWDLETQLRMAAHEHTHVAQWRAAPLRFWWRYAFQKDARAMYEAEAIVSEFEIFEILGLTSRYTPAERVCTLEAYGLTHDGYAAAHDYVLDRVSMNGALRNQKIYTPVGRALFAWHADK